MAQKQKTTKNGRNKVKCQRYRTRKGKVGSKKPRKPGSNRPTRTYGAGASHVSNDGLPFSLTQDQTVEIGVALVSRDGEARRVHPNGGSRLLTVPAGWLR